MSKAKSTKTCKESCCDSNNKSWVFIMKEFETDNNKEEKVEFVQLRHPRTNTAALFLFSPGNKTVQEVLKYSDKPRSFFFGDEIKSNGEVFISAPIDPLYLAIPYLKKYEKCSPLDHVIVDDEFPETERILNCTGLKYVHQVADKRGDDDLNAYIYNEERTLKWLEKKTKRVASALKEKGVQVASNSIISANFAVTKKLEESDDCLRYAHGLISNYLPDSLSLALESHLNLPQSEVEKKRKSNAVENGTNHSNKKAKLDVDSYNCDSPAPVKEKKATPSAKVKAMAKAASGTKSITSFFKKK